MKKSSAWQPGEPIGSYTQTPVHSCISLRGDFSWNGFPNLVKFLEEECVFSPMCSAVWSYTINLKNGMASLTAVSQDRQQEGRR
jgi:hypothetical protein